MRGKMALYVVVVSLAVVLACTAITAQQPVKPPIPPGAKDAKVVKNKTEDVKGDADLLKTSWGGKKNITLLKGNVKFVHPLEDGDVVLTSDQVVYDGDARIAVSPGKVVITSPECDISGDKGSAYFNKRIGVVEGSVVMLVKPKKSDKEASSDKESVRDKLTQQTTITCSKLEYQYKKKIASAVGGVVLKQPQRTAYADKLIYDEKNEKLTLIGNVHGTDEKGQTFSAPGTVIISVKKGDEWMEAPNASVTFKVDLDEDEATTPEKP